jgi:sulfotransferase
VSKNITFLVSLPRSGNTLLGAIFNQNPQVAVTANSITLEIFKEVFLLKETEVFQNFPDHTSLDNVLRGIMDSYYKDWPQKFILDRGPAGTPDNAMVLETYMTQPVKAVLLVRDLTDIFASFLKVLAQTQTLTPKKCDEYLSKIMAKDGMIARALESIRYFTQPENRDRCVIVRYNDLVENPQRELNRIHQFIGISPFEYRFKNFDQFSLAGVEYNDTVFGYNLHTIRTDCVQQMDNKYRQQVPQRLIKKYGHIVF